MKQEEVLLLNFISAALTKATLLLPSQTEQIHVFQVWL